MALENEKKKHCNVKTCQALCNNQKKSFSDPKYVNLAILPESSYKIHNSQEAEYVPKKSKKRSFINSATK